MNKTYKQFAAILGKYNLEKFEKNVKTVNGVNSVVGEKWLEEWKTGEEPITDSLIEEAFNWSQTPEGINYWYRLNEAWKKECLESERLVTVFDKHDLDYEYEYSPTESQEQFFFFNRDQFVKAAKLVADFAEKVESGVSHYTVGFNYTDEDEEVNGEMAIFVTYA